MQFWSHRNSSWITATGIASYVQQQSRRIAAVAKETGNDGESPVSLESQRPSNLPNSIIGQPCPIWATYYMKSHHTSRHCHRNVTSELHWNQNNLVVFQSFIFSYTYKLTIHPHITSLPFKTRCWWKWWPFAEPSSLWPSDALILCIKRPVKVRKLNHKNVNQGPNNQLPSELKKT